MAFGKVAQAQSHLLVGRYRVRSALRMARGTQNKIHESMAMGLPVIATPEAVKGG